MKRCIPILASMIAFAACGGGSSGVDGPPGGTADANNHPDGMLPQGCAPGTIPGTTECSDCVDNDMDGDIDGYDIECTGSADNDEGSFSTGIPGDNIDDKWQDCFFDGDSGAGNDGCRFHTCCLLGTGPGAACPVDQNFDPTTDCPVQPQQCIDFCAPLVPPGCDCFGCCTLCDDAGCVNILTNPAVAPNCDDTVIHDPNLCPVCTPNMECGTPCNPEMCILCPGQDPSDLPPTCTGQMCPNGQIECTTMPCAMGTSCFNGCCIADIP